METAQHNLTRIVSGRFHPMNALLLAGGFPIQYRVLSCAARAGMTVFVLGTPEAVGLRVSNYCKGFFPAPTCDSQNRSAYLAAWKQAIEACLAVRPIDIVIAGDTRSTDVLAALQEQLSVPVYPIPSSAAFEVLHDKWTFFQVCRDLHIQTPDTWLFQSQAEMQAAIKSSSLPEHIIVKPLRLSGNRGVIHFPTDQARQYLRRIDYVPILVQSYVPGQTICLSIFVVEGEVKIAIGYYKQGTEFVFSINEPLLAYATAIAEAFSTNGLLNFDAQVTADGDVYVLECNPRMYFNLDYASVAGMNFLREGLRDWAQHQSVQLRIADQRVKTPSGFCKTLLTPWRISAADLHLVTLRLGDPMPQVIEILRLLVARCPIGMRSLLLKIFRPLRPDAAKYAGL